MPTYPTASVIAASLSRRSNKGQCFEPKTASSRRLTRASRVLSAPSAPTSVASLRTAASSFSRGSAAIDRTLTPPSRRRERRVRDLDRARVFELRELRQHLDLRQHVAAVPLRR